MTDLVAGQTFVFIDLETTGGKPPGDRIIEIGLKVVVDGQVTDTWETLVNPERTIPPFIERYTGITNEMVQDAPLFADIAETFLSKLEGGIFVAHSARFDYSFVKSEFRCQRINFSAKVLCTVKLSRQLYPQFNKHNMDALIERHQLSCGPRHRAMGDVDSMLAFYLHAVAEKGAEPVAQVVAKILQRPSLPSALPPDLVHEIPQSSGVYRFYGENDVLLYVGKAKNIYQRVMAHFSSDHKSTKGLMLSESLRRIDWTLTAGELGALLLESQQIKQLKPLHNKRSRAVQKILTLVLKPNEQGYLAVTIESVDNVADPAGLYGLFRSKAIAQQALQGIIVKNELCARLLGLDKKSDAACYKHKIDKCAGACVGKEDVTRYNLRMQIAFHKLKLKPWPYTGAVALKETNDFPQQVDYQLIYQWVHYGTAHDGQPVEAFDESDFQRRMQTGELSFDLDAYKLIANHLKVASPESVIELPFASHPVC